MTLDPAAYLQKPFGHLSDLINAHAANRPERIALDDGEAKLNWRDTADRVNRIAAQLQADGLIKGQAVAILGTTCVNYALAYLGAIVAGGCAAPLTTSATPKQLANMIADSGAMHLLVDQTKRTELLASGVELPPLKHIMLDKGDADAVTLDKWMADAGALPRNPDVGPDDPYNIIYSSGTTGTPKGIVHSRQMRWHQAAVGERSAYGSEGQGTLLATPLYSNTTLGLFTPTIAYGGTVYLMRKFDCAQYLEIAQRQRVTHTMLVPVQYQRLLKFERFDDYDLSSFQLKYCTSAPFSAELKAEVLRRWPGGLIEIYSMTEGGVVCLLMAHEFPDKLATVGVPWGGSKVITIDENLQRLPIGEIGELVGWSQTMMSGYQNQPEKTREASWFDEEGVRWQRMGDIGKVDADGFVTLMGRSKDMIISGGFNIYPKDLEDALMEHPDVADAAVVGMESEQWGETPVGFVVGAQDLVVDADAVLADVNARLGKTQRISALHIMEELPRSHIGKILKTELRAMLSAK